MSRVFAMCGLVCVYVWRERQYFLTYRADGGGAGNNWASGYNQAQKVSEKIISMLDRSLTHSLSCAYACGHACVCLYMRACTHTRTHWHTTMTNTWVLTHAYISHFLLLFFPSTFVPSFSLSLSLFCLSLSLLREADDCDSLEAFVVAHSIAGGTGSVGEKGGENEKRKEGEKEREREKM